MNDPLQLPATPFRVQAAAEAAALSRAATHRAREIAAASPEGAAWQRFLARALALLGTALVVAGVVCFFAFNWDRIGRFGKLALIEVAIAAAALVGYWKLPRLSGQIAIAAAAVLVGPLLGVYGQTYQTGADPYGLFITWALLITPWVLAARFTVLWLLEVVLLDVGLGLWWAQAGRPPRLYGELGPAVVIGLVHAAAILAWEWQLRRSEPWLTARWAPQELALTGFIALLVPAASLILSPADAGSLNVVGAAGLVSLVTCIVAVFWYHQQIRPDRFMVTVAGAAGLALAAVVVGRLLMEDLDMGGVGLLLVALFVIAEITYGLRWLRQTRPRQYGSEV